MAQNTRPIRQDFDLLRRLTEGFCEPATLPISFYYADRKIQGIPWNAQVDWRRIDSNLTHTTITAKDPATGLEIRAVCEEYNDFPVLEWTVYLTNRGTENTPIIRDLLGIDTALDIADPILQYSDGDRKFEKSFEFYDRPLTSEAFEMEPVHGMACDEAYPYMRILCPGEDYGITLSIGWPGQWNAKLSYDDHKTIVKAGQALTNFYLKPGETVRTPRMTIYAFTGDTRRAINLWRRWYLAHVMPKNNGNLIEPMVVVHADCPETAGGGCMENYTQEIIQKSLDTYDSKGVKYDTFWLDAGWYADCGQEWKKVGTWEARQPNYPEGLLGVKKVCQAHNAEFLVWFDPERVHEGTKIAREHPEWLLETPQELLDEEPWFIGSYVFNMGNPDARQYITDLICNFIQENKLDWYRQDFNIWPLQSWRKNDEADRQGITENLHIQGYLQFWDDLLRRNPGLKIDSCAGGGRRNEMETMRRSVPLHYTDGPAAIPHIRMGFEQTLHEWTPYFRSFMLNAREENEPDEGKSERNADEFLYYCSMAPSVVLCTEFWVDDKEFVPIRKMQDTWYRAAHLMLRSDFYSLTPYHKDRAGWWCRQFDCPEQKDGFIQFVTGKGCTQEELVVKPCLDETATYLFENEQTGERRTMTGEEAMAGFTENLPARSGAIWFYHTID